MTQNKNFLDAERRLAQMNETVLKCTVTTLRMLKELDGQTAGSATDDESAAQTDAELCWKD